MSWSLRIRLSVMMFLQFAIWGAWLPVLSDYLKNDLGYSGGQIAWIDSAMWLASLAAPFVAGQIVDRWLPTQWFLAVSQLIAGGALLAAAHQQAFAALMPWMALFCLFYAPTGALTASLCFRHLKDVSRQFPGIRVWGTVGWIAIGWGLWLWRRAQGAPVPGDMLTLGGWCALAMGVFCFFLPHTPPLKQGRSPWAFVEAFGLLRDRQFLIFMTLALLGSLGSRFYYVASAAFLHDVGVARSAMPALRTISQIAEVAGVAALPILLLRLRIRGCLIVGLAAWLARDLIFALEAPWLVVVGSLALHGIAFPAFFVVSQIYVDKVAPPDIRASTQALLALVTMGLGNFLGVQLSGVVMDHFTVGKATNWSAFYAVPCVLIGVCIVGFLVFFRGPEEPAAG